MRRRLWDNSTEGLGLVTSFLGLPVADFEISTSLNCHSYGADPHGEPLKLGASHKVHAKSPLVSVIIVVRNGRDDILGALDSIREQNYSSLEVVVVDGMSSDGTRALVEEYVRTVPDFSVRLLDNPGLIQSCGWNIGILDATGPYFLRMDAVHCRLQVDYVSSCLRQLLALQQKDPSVAAIGGRRESVAAKGSLWSEAIAMAQCSRFGVGNAVYRLGTRGGVTDTVGVPLYDRKVISQIGLFDESLGRSEDNDFHARMRTHGLKLYFFPEARATYRPRLTLSGLSSQMFHNGWWVSATILRKRSFPFGLRHVAPFGFFLLLLVLVACIAVGLPLAKPALFLIAGFYILASVIAGLQTPPLSRFWRVVLVFWTMHASYAAGTAVGLFEGWNRTPVGEHTAPGANAT